MSRDASLRSAPYRWRTLFFGIAFGLALVLGATATVHAQEGAMAADCEGNSLEVDTDCAFGEGQEFTVAVHITAAPSEGYFGFQAKLRWDGNILDYRPTDDPNREAVWPECAIPARSPEPPTGEPPQLLACFPFPFPAEAFRDVGPALLFTFVCTGEGTSSLTLVPRVLEPAPTPVLDEQLGSHFVDANLSPVDPSLAAASVTCGGAQVPRPEPEVTPRPTEDALVLPTLEPIPTPGGPTATPAAADGTPVSGPDADAGDDDDGGGPPAWTWALIGVAAAAGAGGLGFAAWRRLRSRSQGA